jgi:hypothetical protein
MTNTWLAGDADRDHLMPSTPLFLADPRRRAWMGMGQAFFLRAQCTEKNRPRTCIAWQSSPMLLMLEKTSSSAAAYLAGNGDRRSTIEAIVGTPGSRSGCLTNCPAIFRYDSDALRLHQQAAARMMVVLFAM